MCGIAGIFAGARGAPAERAELERMAQALYHRGPDEFGLYRDKWCGLSHARLSIIDVASGQQPLANTDSSIWLVYNGEIYNYLELKAELEALGHVFRTKSDTEVVVHAWQEWGNACFKRFNGQWSVAIWDTRRKILVLSRDQMGINPLYYAEHAGRVYFASEVKAIFAATPQIPREFDVHGLAQVFTFWGTVPPQTVFRGVAELRPGHVRVYQGDNVSDEAYFQQTFPDPGTRSAYRGSLEDATEQVRQGLERATQLRMTRSDVPVGSYLSGGLDSSLVAALGQKYAPGKFSTYSLRFEDAEYDETEYQRLVSAALASEHREVSVSRRQIADIFPEVVFHTERPILRTAPAPMFLLSRLVRSSGIKVVLTGEGADEVFAGYDIFREGRVRRFWARQPSSTCRPLLLDRLYPYLARSPVAQAALARQFFGKDLGHYQNPGFAHGTRWHTTASTQRIFSPEVAAQLSQRNPVAEFLDTLPPAFNHFSSLAQDQYIENRTLLAGYLLSCQGDRMLLGNSVEGRFPFLDQPLIDLADSLPDAYKLRVLDEKHILKRLGQSLLPQRILQRKKQPYRAPDALAFTDLPADFWLHEVTSASAVKAAGVFAPLAVSTLLDKLRKRGATGQFSNQDNMAVVGLISTQLLYQRFIAEQPLSSKTAEFRVCIERA